MLLKVCYRLKSCAFPSTSLKVVHTAHHSFALLLLLCLIGYQIEKPVTLFAKLQFARQAHMH